MIPPAKMSLRSPIQLAAILTLLSPTNFKAVMGPVNPFQTSALARPGRSRKSSVKTPEAVSQFVDTVSLCLPVYDDNGLCQPEKRRTEAWGGERRQGSR